jgi:hypothetical protein
VVLAHEVYVDPEAKTMNGPYDRAKWCVLRRIRELTAAKLETGKDVKPDGSISEFDPIMDTSDLGGVSLGTVQRGLPVFPTSRLVDSQREGVWEFVIFIPPSPAAGVPNGRWCRIVGNEYVIGGDVLPGGKIPLARFTDGSSDSEMFPRPVLMDSIPDQVVVNTLMSRLIEHVRSFGAGRLLNQKGTLLSETYTNIVGSVVEYVGVKPDLMPTASVGNDVWQLLQFFIKKLEEKLGYTDFARGQVTGSGSFEDVSGRALLGARELYERQFGPMIRAASEGMSDWACLIVDYARFLYDVERLVPIAGRGDLAKKISSRDLGEESVVYVDPSTLSPLPRALRHQMLFDLLEKGLITQDEYRRQAPFAEIRDVYMGGSDQTNRAQMVNTFIEENWQEMEELDVETRFDPEQGGIPVLWQDDPRVHKAALAELALDEFKPLALRDIALERWGMYDMLERAKTLNPQTGQPLSPPPQLVRGIPFDLMPQPQAPAPPTQGEQLAPQQSAPAPDLAPFPTQAGMEAQEGAPDLGQFGGVEEQAMDMQQA